MVGGHDGSADVKVEQICRSQLSEVLAWPFIQDVATARGAAGLFGDSVIVRSWSSVSVQFSQRAEICQSVPLLFAVSAGLQAIVGRVHCVSTGEK